MKKDNVTLDMLEINNKNRFAIAILKVAVEKLENPLYNPIYLCGNKKEISKLLDATIESIIKIEKKAFMTSYKECKLSDCKDYDLLILKNINELEENHEVEEKIKDIINYCITSKKQIILTGDKNPSDLNLSEILKSYMQRGLSVFL